MVTAIISGFKVAGVAFSVLVMAFKAVDTIINKIFPDSKADHKFDKVKEALEDVTDTAKDMKGKIEDGVVEIGKAADDLEDVVEGGL